MGCLFSRRRKPAQDGQLPQQQQEGAGQGAATGEQKAPQYSWDLRAKVPPRRLRLGPGLGQGQRLGLGLGYRLSQRLALSGRPVFAAGRVLRQGARLPRPRCYGSVRAVQSVHLSN